MNALVSVLGASAIAYVILRLLAPVTTKHLTGLRPTGDRPVDRFIKGQTERRGAVLAAIATGWIASLSSGNGHQVGVLALGVIAAVLYRRWPVPMGWVLGGFGVAIDITEGWKLGCDSSGDRRALVVAFILGGLVIFGVCRLMFKAAGFARGSTVSVVLLVFGIVSLGGFVAGPFGFQLTELVGVGGGLTAIATVYAVIIVLTALLPGFAASIIGIMLLVAEITADSVGATDACRLEQDTHAGVVVAACIGFALVWIVAGRFPTRANRWQ